MADLHPNILTYLAAIAAFNANDLRTVGDHVRSDVVYRIPGRSIVAGEYHGIDGFADILTRLRNDSGGTIELTPLAVLADDHNLIARARVTAQRVGKNLDTENCYAFRFIDGKVAHGQVFVSDPDQVDDFWASPPATRSSRPPGRANGTEDIMKSPWKSSTSLEPEREYLVLASSIPPKSRRPTWRLFLGARSPQAVAVADGVIGFSLLARPLHKQ